MPVARDRISSKRHAPTQIATLAIGCLNRSQLWAAKGDSRSERNDRYGVGSVVPQAHLEAPPPFTENSSFPPPRPPSTLCRPSALLSERQKYTAADIYREKCEEWLGRESRLVQLVSH
jgi:hypothetical protein